MFLEHYYLIRCVHRRVACFCAPQVVSDLRGETHSGFFSDALEKSGVAPQHVSVDGAEAWNGVKQQGSRLRYASMIASTEAASLGGDTAAHHKRWP